MEEEIVIDPETGEELGEEYTSSLGVGYPKSKRREGYVEFFRDVVKSKDSIKTSFMNDDEIHAMRILRWATIYADIKGLDMIRNYLFSRAEVIAASTSGRAGNLINAVITTKKEFKAKLKQPEKSKSGFLKSKSKEEQ